MQVTHGDASATKRGPADYFSATVFQMCAWLS
jgi:hypothetical protein